MVFQEFDDDDKIMAFCLPFVIIKGTTFSEDLQK